MPRKRRKKFIKGLRYHVYNRGNRKQKVFLSVADREFFIKKLWLLSRSSQCDILVHAYCLMDNHYHLILEQRGNVSISTFMQRLICSYSTYINKKYGFVGHVFQGRFKCTHIRNENGLRCFKKYLWYNAVKAGYVYDPRHYRWVYIRGGQT